jgi:DivIVA domain-containing protein
MPSRGESLSMFVIQRAFSRVRRGYDPDEVDRHLELVSQWFTSTDIGREFTHERAELQRRERAVAAKEAEQAHSIEGARLEAEATLEGARRRADAEARVAGRTLAEAHSEAAAIRADAERRRTEMLEQARAEAAAAEVIRAAEERAAAMVADMSAEAERMLADARAAAERELIAARRDRERRLTEVRVEAAELAESLRAQADEELRVYTDRRRREADRLAQAARRKPS